jgi:hypothetical protein
MRKHLLIAWLFLVSCAYAQNATTAKYTLDGNDAATLQFFTPNNTQIFKTSLGIPFKLEWTVAPTSISSNGTAGQIAYANNYLYICVSPNKWKRTLIGDW